MSQRLGFFRDILYLYSKDSKNKGTANRGDKAMDIANIKTQNILLIIASVACLATAFLISGSTPAVFSLASGCIPLAIFIYKSRKCQAETSILAQKLQDIALKEGIDTARLSTTELANAIEGKLIHYSIEKKDIEDKYTSVFNSTTDGIIITDDDFNIIAVNKSIEHFLGITSFDDGKTNILQFVAPQYRESLLKRRQAINDEMVIPLFEVIVNRVDGQVLHAEINSQSIHYNGKKAVLTIVRDLTERKKAEEKLRINETILGKQNEELIEKNKQLEETNKLLNEANLKAQESESLKTAFLQNMSHEIRTPMNGIIGFSGLLSNPNLNEEKRQYYVSTINKSCGQLLLIVNDILDISKLETGQVEITSGYYRLNSMLSDVYSHHFVKSDYKSITLNFSCGLENGKDLVSVDEHKLRQTLNYLIDNAYKFTKEGSVSFGYTVKGTNLEFFVQDTGIGIEPADHKRIFDRFQQVDFSAARKYGGSGLGLSICKGYIELMGGNIWVESEVGKGATFFFTIPLKLYAEESAQQHVIIEEEDNNKLTGIKILVAEDEETNYLFIKEILENLSAQLIHANNGKDAVYLCTNRNDIDLVIMDIKMPIMDGLAATKAIKKIKPHIPVIAQTAFAMTNDKLNAIEAGCDDYISKPISFNNLISIIEKHLHRQG